MSTLSVVVITVCAAWLVGICLVVCWVVAVELMIYRRRRAVRQENLRDVDWDAELFMLR